MEHFFLGNISRTGRSSEHRCGQPQGQSGCIDISIYPAGVSRYAATLGSAVPTVSGLVGIAGRIYRVAPDVAAR